MESRQDPDYMMRANLESIELGMKELYGGKENKPMANIIYNYLGKGKINHLVTFSEFIYFCRELQLKKEHQNLLIFKMISNNEKELSVQMLLRQFVNSQSGSPFANEIQLILDTYIDRTLGKKIGRK